MTNEEIIEQLENAIELIKQNGKDWLDDRDIPILEVCIKSLITLDKIRVEINELSELEHIEPTYEDCKRDVLEIINKRTSGAKMQEVKL